MNISVKKSRPVSAVYMYRHFRGVREQHNHETREQTTADSYHKYFRSASTSCLRTPTASSIYYNVQKRERVSSAPVFRHRKSLIVSRPSSHTKALTSPYPRQPELNRYLVPLDKIAWDSEYPDYAPVDFTSPSIKAKPVWADPDYKNDSVEKAAKWNALDGVVDRKSHTGAYQVIQGLPRNPVGRTGMCSRGMLGKWGPNHAADPIVTRWKRDSNGAIIRHTESGKPVLQFVCIQRKDSGEWALPGGMVDPGDNISITLKKEFAEEAMNCMEASERDQKHIAELVNVVFRNGYQVYSGYVDDPRNTDNSWMETVAVNFHDDKGDGAGRFHLHAGDDAGQVNWADMDQNLKLYASHQMFIQEVAKKHNCHW